MATDPIVQQQFQHLYQDHHDWIYSWLYRKLGNENDAADLAHDTFVRVLARNQVMELQQPKAYLTTVAKGIMVNWLQRQRIERAYQEVLLNQDIQEPPSPEQSYLIIESLVEINKLLNELPVLVKQVFLYAQLDGLTYEQIAQKMKLSLSTVKRYMKQAYKQCLLVMLQEE